MKSKFAATLLVPLILAYGCIKEKRIEENLIDSFREPGLTRRLAEHELNSYQNHPGIQETINTHGREFTIQQIQYFYEHNQKFY
jgi:hypothetical protein